MSDTEDLLRAKLNAETGKISWKEIERHFARGVLIRVSGEMDLVEVAFRMATDDRATVERWLNEGDIARASEDDAAGWNARDAVFWAVVAAPWVLVQEIEPDATLQSRH
jgi:hypothetical protein